MTLQPIKRCTLESVNVIVLDHIHQIEPSNTHINLRASLKSSFAASQSISNPDWFSFRLCPEYYQTHSANADITQNPLNTHNNLSASLKSSFVASHSIGAVHASSALPDPVCVPM